MIETFNPLVRPSPGTKLSPKVSLNETEFGDGYTLASPNGLNHIRYDVDLTWKGLTLAQFTQINDFFERHGGYRVFMYEVRGLQGVRKWTCKSWSGADGAPWSFKAKLEESFALTA